MQALNLNKYQTALAGADGIRMIGRVKEIVGLVIQSQGPPASIGELCHIVIPGSDRMVRAEVVGFRSGDILLMPIDNVVGMTPGAMVIPTGRPLQAPVGDALLGRILDGVGVPMDERPLPADVEYRSIQSRPPSPLKRRRITEKLGLGIRSMDGITTVGRGQRVGIFSGSGVGKSTVMGMIARNTQADVNVIGLVGERGREVPDFLAKDLGVEGLKRSVVIVATSDTPPLIRLRSAFVATTIAEYFRDQGLDVMLMIDSITRFARAQRDVGQTVGEAIGRGGYPPSVFELLPKLLERAGTAETGSITAIYTVLVEGDDMNEPVADNVRAILDGHIVLSRDLATRGHYPAVDVMESVSRLMIDVVSKEHLHAARKLQKTIAIYREAEDLINIGAYVEGSNPEIDYAKRKINAVNQFLCQEIEEKITPEMSIEQLIALMKD